MGNEGKRMAGKEGMRVKGSQEEFGFDVERSSVLWAALLGKECAWKAGERQANRKPLQ